MGAVGDEARSEAGDVTATSDALDRPLVPDLVEALVPVGGLVVVASDLHLPPRETDTSTRAVDTLTARLDREQVHTVVLAGDILEVLAFPDAGPGQVLDSHPQLVQALQAVGAGGGQVVYVLGNHDGDLAWDQKALAEVTSRLDVTVCLGVDVVFAGSADAPGRRVRVEHGHQLDAYNRFVDQRNPLDTPLGHHIVGQLLPQVEALGAGWLQDTRELADPTGFPSFLASRLAYRQMGRHLWWLLLPVVIVVGLHVPEVELLSGSSATSVWARRAQALAAGGLVDLVVLAALVWLMARRTWRSISALGRGERGTGQNFAARQRGVQLVGEGFSGLITGHTHHPELQPMHGGFYANTGSGTPRLEAVPAWLRLPPAYLRAQQVCWVECVQTDTLNVELVVARHPLPGASHLERLVTAGRRSSGQPATAVARWPARITLPAPSSGLAAGHAHHPKKLGAPSSPPAAAATSKPPAPQRAPRRWRSPGRLAPTVLALLVAVFGLASLVSALVPAGRERISDFTLVPEPATAAATAATAAAGMLLFYLAHGLRRRKSRAWRIAVAATALVLVSQTLDRDPVHVVAAAVLLAVLVLGRGQFYALGDPSTRRRSVQVFAVLLVLAVIAGMGLLRHYQARIVGHPSLLSEFQHVAAGLVGVSGPVRFRTAHADDVVTFTLIAFGLLTAFVTAYLALRPATSSVGLSQEEDQRLRALLAAQGRRDSLGYFALRHDKTLAWSSTGKAAVAYRVIGGVALASGDPIGDPEAWPGALDVFLERARTHAWVPAVLGCSEAGGTAWRRVGLDALELGDEAVLDVAGFSLQGRAMRNVRQAAGRPSRAGYTVRIRRLGDIPDTELEDLRRAVATWRGAGTERGFSMALSRFGDRRDDECVVVSAHLAGRTMGVLNFVPWGPDGLSLDLMSRDRSAENGLNEFLITELVAAATTLDVTRISLNFAVFRSTLERGERLGAGPVTRLWSGVLIWASRWWQIDSLYHFNAKFQPEWYPRYVCFPTGRELPRIAVAALEAEAFLALPRPFRPTAVATEGNTSPRPRPTSR